MAEGSSGGTGDQRPGEGDGEPPESRRPEPEPDAGPDAEPDPRPDPRPDPQPDPQPQSHSALKIALLSAGVTAAATIVAALITQGGDSGNDAGASTPTVSSAPGPQETGDTPAPTDDGSDDSTGAGDQEPASWTIAWEDQEFRLPPASEYSQRMRLADFDGEYGPEVSELDSNAFYPDTNPADLVYDGNEVRLSSGRHLGLSGEAEPGAEECRRKALSRPVSSEELGVDGDDARALSPVKNGSGLCLVTDRGNVAWIRIAEFIDSEPQQSLGSLYTLKGEVTLWKPA